MGELANSLLSLPDEAKTQLIENYGLPQAEQQVVELDKCAPENKNEGLSMLNTLSTHVVQDFPSIKQEAFSGLAGEIVRTIEPHSEADPVALLINIMTVFGNVIGKGPHFTVESDQHCLKLFPVLVGETAKGRKGTSWGYPKKLFKMVNPGWIDNNVLSGLSSGEGLIWAVRDPVEKGGKVVNTEKVIVDEGVKDKRVLVLEPEFASVLKVLSREGNTLSSIIRQAWDGDDLRTLTKNAPVKATGAHISILGHITKQELIRYLSETESCNGFGNRFIFLCVKRSKCLPDGGGYVDFDPLVSKLESAIEFSKTVNEIRKDQDARSIWHEVYPTLS